MSQLIAAAAAQTGYPPEFTALVGVLGAVVGGAIGLLGQRLNILEQRRKDVRDQVLKMVQESRVLRASMSRRRRLGKDVSQDKKDELYEAGRAAIDNFAHYVSYLEITLPLRLRPRVDEFADRTATYLKLALKSTDASAVRQAEEDMDRSMQALIDDMTPRTKRLVRRLLSQ